jgi:amphi-Trp domain-containing protein
LRTDLGWLRSSGLKLALALHPGALVVMTKHKIEYDERRSLASTIDQLQSVVDGLRSRALTIAHGNRRLLFLLEPGSPLELSIYAERSGNRERLEISLAWRRQHLRIGSSPVAQAAPEQLGHAREEESGPEELDDRELDDSELEDREVVEEQDDDWDDEVETIRQGSDRLAQALQQNSLEH